MKIAVVVHGRFHAFDLVRSLIRRGVDVVVFTNYPAWAVERFGVPRVNVQSFTLHGVLSRIAGWISSKTGWEYESLLHPMFSRWAARRLSTEKWDVIHAWTGVAEEIYSDPEFSGSLKLVMRGSAHIQTQARLLREEQIRVNSLVDQPSQWMAAREQREYSLADHIVVLSSFARDSFLQEGIPAEKLRFLPLGTNVSAFRPTESVAAARRTRILAGARLRVLYVGGVSWQKGFADLSEIVKRSAGQFDFKIVGPVGPEAKEAAASLRTQAVFINKRPQNELPVEYTWGDVFVFPTIQDGYAVVIAQASAAGLPILTTPNCCGPDLIKEGVTGWILPIRDPEAFLQRLRWCDEHREALAQAADACYSGFRTRDWDDVAADFEALCLTGIGAHTGATPPSHV